MKRNSEPSRFLTGKQGHPGSPRWGDEGNDRTPWWKRYYRKLRRRTDKSDNIARRDTDT